MDVTQKLKNRSKGVRNCKASEQLFHFNSTKEITAPDCFLSATVKIQRGNFKHTLVSRPSSALQFYSESQGKEVFTHL
jgi:hypothetical protein